MYPKFSQIIGGVSAWAGNKPYHRSAEEAPRVFHLYQDCEDGLKIELRHLRKGKDKAGNRRLCEVCAGRVAATK